MALSKIVKINDLANHFKTTPDLIEECLAISSKRTNISENQILDVIASFVFDISTEKQIKYQTIKYIPKTSKIEIIFKGENIKIRNPVPGNIFLLKLFGYDGKREDYSCVVTKVYYTRNNKRPNRLDYEAIVNFKNDIIKYEQKSGGILTLYFNKENFGNWSINPTHNIFFVSWDKKL